MKKTKTKPQLILKKLGKKTYYHDPLRDAFRNIENPRDVEIPRTRAEISLMLYKVRNEDY